MNIPKTIAACILLLSAPAYAADGSKNEDGNSFEHWFVRAGPAQVIYHDGATIAVKGATVPGASLKIKDNTTVELEGGYYFNPNVSVSLTAGVPPTLSLYGRGPLDGLKLGRVTYGPAVAAMQYHLTALGSRFEPYVGAGVGYAIVLKDHDRAIKGLHVANPVGVTLQGGVESMVTRRFAIFADVKHIYFGTSARGTFQGSPATARVRLDPTIVSAGVSLHF